MDNLLDKNGCRFRATIQGEKCEGVIYVERSKVYLLQNAQAGSRPSDFPKEYGLKYSWVVAEGSPYDLERNDVEDFEIIEESTTFKSSKDRKKLLLFL